MTCIIRKNKLYNILYIYNLFLCVCVYIYIYVCVYIIYNILICNNFYKLLFTILLLYFYFTVLLIIAYTSGYQTYFITIIVFINNS